MKKNNVSKFITVMLILAMLVSVIAVSATADETTIPASGYAAIGIVDAEAHKAEVLLGTGEQGTVYFNGAAPASGAVYSYTRDANNLYTFTTPSANHGYNNQLGDIGWNLYYTPDGWLWPGNGEIFFPDGNPIFVRFGNDGWALTTIFDFVQNNGAVWVYAYLLDVTVRDANANYWNAAAIVVGGYNNGTIDTSNYDVTFKNLTATNSLAAFTTSLHANVNTDAMILETGYAAIGAVDAANSYVEILKGTGEQGFVIYEGTAPTTGGVYRYSRNASNVYTFELPVANHGNSNTADASAGAWPTWMSAEYGGYMWDGALNHYWPSASTPFFVHTSANTWVVTDLSCLVTDNGATYRMTYQLDVTVRDASVNYYNTAAVVFGGLNADGSVDTTGIDSLNLPMAAGIAMYEFTKHDWN
ncbi:MAG: hypothetical protein E7436_05725 [Ruminococcaceae bacterium]|nr:hypothetical protein [Oscillospiraceae bacterium]